MNSPINFFTPSIGNATNNSDILNYCKSNNLRIYTSNEGYDVYISNDQIYGYGSNRTVEITYICDGHKQYSTYSNLLRGEFKNIFATNNYGGYMGVSRGVFESSLYDKWNNMLRRVTNAKNNPAYSNTIIDERWYNFHNFAIWYNYQISLLVKLDNGYRYEIDKDIIANVNNTKSIYGPDTCILIPNKINSIIGGSKPSTIYYPGVCKNKNRYSSSLTIDGVKKHFGTYDTPEEAYEVYKRVKKAHIMELADYFYSIGALTDFAYEMLQKYEVKY